jgi:hypothetical protein
MKKFLAPLFAAVAVAAFASGDARASIVWTYDWTGTASSVSDGKYSMGVTPYSGSATDSTDILAANLSLSPVGNYTGTDTFNKTLLLTGSVQGHTVSFDIGISATIASPNTVTFNYPATVTPVGPTSDNNGFSASVVSVTFPGANNSGSGGLGVGAISVHVTPDGSGTPNGTPEPSTMLLSCVGLAFGGFATWRKRNQAIAA